jgi:uncharacterized alpha-E superfamily protein
MLSRVADSLYWMSRYLERAEHTARLLDLTLNLTLELSPDAAGGHWRRLLAGLRTPPPAGAADSGVKLRPYELTQYLTFDVANGASIVSCITAARENARQVREQISSEMWEGINRLYLQVRREQIDTIWHAQPHEFFRAIKEGAHLFQGTTDSTMSHGDGWRFMQLGRFIERAGATALLLDVHFNEVGAGSETSAGGHEYLRLVSLLKSCSAFEAYCQFYKADLRPERIIEFLLLSADFPRSVRFAADVVERSLMAIASDNSPRKAGRAERLAGKLRATLDYSQVDEIISDNLHAYLDNIQRQCAQIHTTMQQSYIAYAVEAALAS